MASSDFKSTASDLKSVNSSVRDTMRDAKNMGEKAMDDTSPRIRETIDQFTDVASDIMNRANTWMKQGNNRNYSYVAMAAAVGVAGFMIGRSMNSSSKLSSLDS
jgi:ElaB/YqjD/DUF883 family membrane-anchored ribosome-binding protein